MRLFLYLAKEVLTTMLAVSIVLLLIVMSGRFVKYLAEAAAGDLAPEVVFAVMAYRLPGFLELVLPLGFFIGILLAYGRLYVESEMVVMSACGLSTSRLALFTVLPSLFVAAIVAMLTLYATPIGMANVQAIFQESKNANGLETLVAGRFRLDEQSRRVTYVEALDKEQAYLNNVFSAEQVRTEDGKPQLRILYATAGQLSFKEQYNKEYLDLTDGFEYTGVPGGKKLEVTEFDLFSQKVKSKKERPLLNKKTDARSTAALIESGTLEDMATLQWRISIIMLVPIIALIAQAMSRTNHRRGRYVQLLPAFLLYIMYLVLLNAARDALEKGKVPPEVGMWWVHGIFLLIAVFLLYSKQWYYKLRFRGAPSAVQG